MPFLRDIEKLIRQPVPMTIDTRTGPVTRQEPDEPRGNRQRNGNRRPEQPRGEKRQHPNRETRHADGGQPKRGKGRSGGNQNRPNGGGEPSRQGNRNAAPRPHADGGGAIADIRFMGRPRRPGMTQGSASSR
jgi:hypothetical protein